MTDALSAFGQRLALLRTGRGLRQDDLATATGLARGSIANMEAGRQNTGLRQLVALADAGGMWVTEMSLWTEADARADRLRAQGAEHEPHCWWGQCWCHGGLDERLPEPPAEYLAGIETGEDDTGDPH